MNRRVLVGLALLPWSIGMGQGSCLDRIPADAMTPVPIALVADVPDSLVVLRRHAESLSWAASDHIRSMLGVPDGDLPEATGLEWRDVDVELRVFVRPNGTFSWRISGDGDTPVATLTGRRGHALLDSALARIAAANPHSFPAGAVRVDSQSFTLGFRAPVIRRGGTVEPLRTRFAIPLFTLRRPWEAEVGVVSIARGDYPHYARRNGVQGTIIIRAVVDTSGRVDSATVVDEWTADKPRPRGEWAEYYQDFVQAARRAMLRSRYSPAIIGGCPVRRVVSQPFEFLLSR